MKFRRLHSPSAESSDLYAGIGFKIAVGSVRDSNGAKVFEMEGLEVPSSWSQVAIDVVADKYFCRTGVPSIVKKVEENGIPDWLWRSEPDFVALEEYDKQQRFSGEHSVKQVFHRLVGTWTYWGWKGGYFSSEIDARVFYDELCVILARQMAAPSSQQWLNCGLHWAYGIEGDDEGFVWDTQSSQMCSGKSISERPSVFSCALLSLSDSIFGKGGIIDLWAREAKTFGSGAGVGCNYSNLRSTGEDISGGASSCGLMSFLEAGDRVASTVKSGGRYQRAARMVTVDIDHPEVETFINWKVVEEQKVSSLVSGSQTHAVKLDEVAKAISNWQGDKAEALDPSTNYRLKEAIVAAQSSKIPDGYIRRVLQYFEQGFTSFEFATFDVDWGSEAYNSVSGQNSINLVRIPSSYISSVEEKHEWSLVRRSDGGVEKSVNAEALWENLAHAAWVCGDPGVMFSDRVEEWNTCSSSGKINTVSPASEFAFLDDTACVLANLNLRKYFSNGLFDVESYQHSIDLWTVVLDISTNMGRYPTANVAQNSHDFRPIGLGISNLGSLLIAMGVSYDSEEARSTCSALAAVLTATAYLSSARIAKELGPFDRYAENSQCMLSVLENHHRVVAGGVVQHVGIDPQLQPIDALRCVDPHLVQVADRTWYSAIELGKSFGFRNSQVTLCGPTGTTGLVLDCETSGIEPDFASIKFRKLESGGFFKTVGQTSISALERLNYSDEQIEDIIDYIFGRPSLADSPFINHASLAKKGFGKVQLDALDELLPTAFDLDFLFNVNVLGEDFCIEVLGIGEGNRDNPKFSLLEYLGFERREIQLTSDFLLGTMTFEGAPHLREEHYSVFDLSQRAGKKGKRYLSVDSHLRMIAAIQPHISGGVSKTVVLPEDATVEDCSQVFSWAHKLGLKSVSIYREGSKLSQPVTKPLLGN